MKLTQSTLYILLAIWLNRKSKEHHHPGKYFKLSSNELKDFEQRLVTFQNSFDLLEKHELIRSFDAGEVTITFKRNQLIKSYLKSINQWFGENGCAGAYLDLLVSLSKLDGNTIPLTDGNYLNPINR